MANTHQDSILLLLPADKIPLLINSALRRLHWQDIFFDTVSQITAKQTKPITIKGNTWHFDFAVVVTWDADDQSGQSGSLVQIELSENNYQWSIQECQKKCAELVSAITISAERSKVPTSKPPKGARWVTENELRAGGYYVQAPDGTLPVEKGFLKTIATSLIITGERGKHYLCVPEQSTNKHALVCGPTGSGKSSGLYKPNLYERTGACAIVTEATAGKGRADLYESTAGYRAQKGHQVFYFNPNDLKSNTVNPLDWVKTARDAKRFAEIIMQSTTLGKNRSGDQSWEMSERLLLKALILHCVGERESNNCNLGYINELLTKHADQLETMLLNSRVELARKTYQAFVKWSTENYRNLVASGQITRLDIFSDPVIARLMSTTDVDTNVLENDLWTFYLAVPADKSEMKPVAALMFNVLLEIATSLKLKHPLMLMLDEFINFGYVKGMPGKLTIIRHDKVPAMLGVQDYAQLEELYGGEAKILISQPATRIFFKPNDLRTAEHISKMLGVAVHEETRLTSTGQVHQQTDRKPLLGPDELMHLGSIDEYRAGGQDTENMIVFLPDTRPVKIKSFSWQDYEAEGRCPPPPRVEHSVNQRLEISEPALPVLVLPDEVQPDEVQVDEVQPPAVVPLAVPAKVEQPDMTLDKQLVAVVEKETADTKTKNSFGKEEFDDEDGLPKGGW